MNSYQYTDLIYNERRLSVLTLDINVAIFYKLQNCLFAFRLSHLWYNVKSIVKKSHLKCKSIDLAQL